MTRHPGFTWSMLTALLVAASAGAFAESHIRIVRLSSVEGQVQMDRTTGDGLERAIMNTPVVQGMRLTTGSEGLTEIEFENQSALRLAGDSEVKFTELSMNNAGDKTNQVEVVKGLVYLSTTSKGDDVYRVTADGTDLLVHRDSEMRLSAGAGKIEVAVFRGSVQLEGQASPISVQKNETLTVEPGKPAVVTVTKGTEAVRFDGWNKERDAYKKTYADNTGYGGPNRAYGMQDLNYYGDFFYANGYGYVWQPYGFAGAMTSWDPYSNGAWGFVPGMGYAFASGYPWGWLPFHYGSWAFVNGAGWAWLPGGNYGNEWYANNFQTVPKVVKAPAGWAAPAVPTLASRATVLVGKHAGAPVMIPGGRIPPKFGSVISGRSAGNPAAHGFASPNTRTVAATHASFASPDSGLGAQHHGVPTHVFAAPTPRSGFVDPITADPLISHGAGPAPSHIGAGAATGAAHAGGAAAAAHR